MGHLRQSRWPAGVHAAGRILPRPGARVPGAGGRDGEETANSAQRLNEEWGFTAFKLSPFRLSPDVARWGRICAEAAKYFEEIRQHAPADFEFAFDPHAKIFEPVRALQLANALAPYDPYFYEEPLRPEHTAAWARLRQQMQIPLATGECLYTRWEFLDLMAAQAVDIIQPDVCVCGGLLEMRKIAAIAEAHYVSVAPHKPHGAGGHCGQRALCCGHAQLQILEYISP